MDEVGSGDADSGDGAAVNGHVMPRWVKDFLIAAVVVGVLVAVLLVISGGDHGPGRHQSGVGPSVVERTVDLFPAPGPRGQRVA